MKGKARKVAIVGAGMVGSSCAYSMVNQSICDEIMMIDRTYDRALGPCTGSVPLYGVYVHTH